MHVKVNKSAGCTYWRSGVPNDVNLENISKKAIIVCICKMMVVIMIRLRISAVHQHSKVSFGIFRSHEIKFWFYDPRFSPKPTLNKKFLKTKKSFKTRIFERRIFGQLVFIRRVSLLLKGIPCFESSKSDPDFQISYKGRSD